MPAIQSTTTGQFVFNYGAVGANIITTPTPSVRCCVHPLLASSADRIEESLNSRSTCAARDHYPDPRLEWALRSPRTAGMSIF